MKGKSISSSLSDLVLFIEDAIFFSFTFDILFWVIHFFWHCIVWRIIGSSKPHAHPWFDLNWFDIDLYSNWTPAWCYTSKLLTSMMTYCRHYKCHKCRLLAISVASVTYIIQLYFPCRVSNDITRTLQRHPQRLV
jgi:hypothetical protein